MSLIFISPYQQNNNGDAFRHCMWSTIISKKTSPDWATRWLNAHEAPHAINNISRRMDDLNNASGVKLFKDNPSAKIGDFIYLCSKLVGEGQLVRVENGTLIPTNYERFKVPDVYQIISEKADEVLEFLVDYFGDKTKEVDADGNSALHRCIQDDYEHGFNLLVKFVDVNIPGDMGWTPLMLCGRIAGSARYVSILLANGADPNYQDPFDGETALMKAAIYGNREVIEILLPVSNKKIKSKSGFTAHDKALSEGNLDIAKLLL